MENNTIPSTSIKNQKEDLYTRILSSFIFLPAIILMYFASYETFCIMIFITAVAITFEIFSKKSEKQFGLRIFAWLISILGLIGLAYCRLKLGFDGCIFLICITSFTDIGAYSFGKLIGGPKLCPKISPNKTWAGLIGGYLVTNIMIYMINKIFSGNSFHLMGFDKTQTIIILQILIMAAILGDLLESAFKRKIGVKDMGNLFPGHGGMMDRLDSLIVASIFLSIIIFLF